MFRNLARAAVTSAVALSLLAGTALPSLAIPYHGKPDLKITVDVVTAGQGHKGFSSQVLFKHMYPGKAMPREAVRLLKQYGPGGVADFFPIMNYSIDDVVRMAKRDHVALPKPDVPLSALNLDRSLVVLGQSPKGTYDVGYMLERMISNPYHHELMMDLDMHFSQKRVARFHSVLGTVVQDTNRLQ